MNNCILISDSFVQKWEKIRVKLVLGLAVVILLELGLAIAPVAYHCQQATALSSVRAYNKCWEYV